MKFRTKRVLVPLIGALSMLGVGASVAVAAEGSNDGWSPVNTGFTVTSTNSAFSANGVTISCQTFSLSGTSPAGNGTTWTDGTAITVTPSVSGTCNHPVTFSGTWRLALFSTSANGCTTDADGSDDCAKVTIPSGSSVTITGLICGTLTVSGPYTSPAVPYEDDGTGTVNLGSIVNNVPWKCGFFSGNNGNFTGTFTSSTDFVDE